MSHSTIQTLNCDVGFYLTKFYFLWREEMATIFIPGVLWSELQEWRQKKNLSWCPHDNLPPSHSSFSPLHPWGLFFRSTRRRDPTTSLFTNSFVLCIEHKMEKDFIISLNVFFREKNFYISERKKTVLN